MRSKLFLEIMIVLKRKGEFNIMKKLNVVQNALKRLMVVVLSIGVLIIVVLLAKYIVQTGNEFKKVQDDKRVQDASEVIQDCVETSLYYQFNPGVGPLQWKNIIDCPKAPNKDKR